MPIPNISNNAADIYEASLLYEQNGKCGTTRVLEDGDVWTWTTNSEKCWKISVILETDLAVLTADNISAADCTKIVGASLPAGTELLASFATMTVTTGLVILYMDCPQS
jgi:hypothetical protein